MQYYTTPGILFFVRVAIGPACGIIPRSNAIVRICAARIFAGPGLARAPFQRTISRLEEMQTHVYLAEEHLPYY